MKSPTAYLYMVRQCPYIHTLIIRERISSSTVLLLAYSGKNLRYFHVRSGFFYEFDLTQIESPEKENNNFE